MRYYRRRPQQDYKLQAEINVTPLVDVGPRSIDHLHGYRPHAPDGHRRQPAQGQVKSVDISEEKLILTINGAKEIFINKTKIPTGDLRTKVESILTSRIDKEIFMRADKNVPYGFVVEVMSEIRKAGVDKLGMITEPPQETP